MILTLKTGHEIKLENISNFYVKKRLVLNGETGRMREDGWGVYADEYDGTSHFIKRFDMDQLHEAVAMKNLLITTKYYTNPN